MRRLPAGLALALAVLLTPRVAAAQPAFHMAWDACAGTAGSSSAKSFTGPGVYRQVVSATGLTGTVTGYEVILRARAPGGLADAWRFDAAGCQADLVAITSAAASKACPSLSGSASVNRMITYDPASGSIDLRMTAIFPSVTASAASTYTLFRIDYDLGAATAGESMPGTSCGGAEQPVCFAIVDAQWLDGAFAAAHAAVGDGSVTWNDPAGATACSAANLDGIRIDEMMTACASGDTTMQFIELVADRPSTFSSALRLELRTKEGLYVLDGNDLFPGREGQPWAPGTRWLIATPGFEAATGLAADLVLPLPLDPEGGSILLSDDRPGAPAVDALEYGHPGEPAAPTPGHSLRREPGGTFAETASPDPTNASGATATTFACRSIATGVRIQEFAIDCAGCPRQSRPFVELVAVEPGQRFAAGLRLRILSGGGAILFDGGGLFPAGLAGAEWPEGQTWLLGSPASQPPPDHAFFAALAADGGTLRLYDGTAGGAVVSEVRYGPGGFPAPALGRSLVRIAEGQYAAEEVPTPTRADGQASAPPGCYQTEPSSPPMAMTRFSEVGLACDQGDSRSQFIELTSMADQVFQPGLRLRLRNGSGAGVFDIADVFASKPAGTPWPAGSKWLLATALFAEVTGLVPDVVLPGFLPTDGATLVLDDGEECAPQTVDQIAYGIVGAVPPPAPGRSLERTPDGSLVETATISPTRFDGTSVGANTCPCPIATLTCGSEVVHHSEPAANLQCPQGGSRYDLVHGEFYCFTWGEGSSSTSVDAGDDYTITGLPAGTLVSFAAQVEIDADACGGYDGSGFAVGRVRDGTNEVNLQVSDFGRGNCNSENRVSRLELQKLAGEPFRLLYHLATGGDTGGQGSVAVRLVFVDLPPGARITSCNGYKQDGPTSTRTSLVHQEVSPGRVRLAWQSSSGDEIEGAVERRTEADDWVAVAMLRPGPGGRFEYEEGGLDAGGRFAYRLGVLHDGVRDWTEPVWVDVPANLRFAIENVAPNPSAGDAFISFSLPGAGAVRIEILDVQGRVVLALAPGAPGPGRHTMRLAGSGRLAAGVYLLRLVHGGEVVTTKLARAR